MLPIRARRPGDPVEFSASRENALDRMLQQFGLDGGGRGALLRGRGALPGARPLRPTIRLGGTRPAFSALAYHYGIISDVNLVPLEYWLLAENSPTDGGNNFVVTLDSGRSGDCVPVAFMGETVPVRFKVPATVPGLGMPMRWALDSANVGLLKPWTHGRAMSLKPTAEYEGGVTGGQEMLGLFHLMPEPIGMTCSAVLAADLPAGASSTATFDGFMTQRAEPVWDTYSVLGTGKKIASGQRVRFVYSAGHTATRWEIDAAACAQVANA